MTEPCIIYRVNAAITSICLFVSLTRQIKSNQKEFVLQTSSPSEQKNIAVVQPELMVKSGSQRVLKSWKTVFVWICGAIAPISTALVGLVLARLLPTAGYGQVAFFFSILGLVILLGSMGLTTQVVAVTSRYVSLEQPTILAQEVGQLLALRLLSLGLFLLIALITFAAGQTIIALGIGIGALVLLNGFTVGILQGGKFVLLATVLQVLPALVYLIGILILQVNEPGSVYLLAGSSYLITFLVAVSRVPAIVSLKPKHLLVTPRNLLANMLVAGRVYIVTLALASFGMYGAMVLGSSGRFVETSAFALSFSLISFPATALTLVLTVLFHPKLCSLVARGSFQEAADWFDGFYRICMAGAVAIASVLFTHSHFTITFLFSTKYAFAASVLEWLAPAVIFSTLSQLLSVNMLGHEAFRGALAGALSQMLTLFVTGGLALASGQNSLQNFALAHSVAAGVGFVVSLYFTAKLPFYQLRIKRLALTTGVVFGIAGLSQILLPEQSNVLFEFVKLALVSIVNLIAALIIAYGPRSFIKLKLN